MILVNIPHVFLFSYHCVNTSYLDQLFISQQCFTLTVQTNVLFLVLQVRMNTAELRSFTMVR